MLDNDQGQKKEQGKGDWNPVGEMGAGYNVNYDVKPTR